MEWNMLKSFLNNPDYRCFGIQMIRQAFLPSSPTPKISLFVLTKFKDVLQSKFEHLLDPPVCNILQTKKERICSSGNFSTQICYPSLNKASKGLFSGSYMQAIGTTKKREIALQGTLGQASKICLLKHSELHKNKQFL